MENLGCLCESMLRYIGQTVTIFTSSGGLSGSGFTGVLVSCDCECIRLLCDVGAAPACSIGSSCTSIGSPMGFNSGGFGGGGFGGGGFGSGFGGGGFGGGGCCGGGCCGGNCGGNDGFVGNPFGAIAVIPMCAVVCFTHNAI